MDELCAFKHQPNQHADSLWAQPGAPWLRPQEEQHVWHSLVVMRERVLWSWTMQLLWPWTMWVLDQSRGDPDQHCWCWVVHPACMLVSITYHEQQYPNETTWTLRNLFSTVTYVNFFLLKDDQCYKQVLRDLCCAVSLFNMTLNHQPQVQTWICQCAIQRNMHRRLRSVFKAVFTTPLTPISAGKTTPERNTAPP